MIARCVGRDPYDKSRTAVVAQWSMAGRLSHFLKRKAHRAPRRLGKEIGRMAAATRPSENDELRRASGTAEAPSV